MSKFIQFLKKILPPFIIKILINIYIGFIHIYRKIYLITKSEFCITKHGFRIMGTQNDISMKYSFYKYGTWEEHIVDFIQKTINIGDIVLDIGANVGFDTMIISQCIGKNGLVYAFEPSKGTYEILNKNIFELNTFENNIKLINKGVGSKSETVKLYLDKNSAGGSTICHNYGGECESIDIITIDSLELEKVDFIKMDIEGYEYEALLGMEKLLKDNINIKIIFEWSPQFYHKLSSNGKEYSINILKYLTNLGFVLYEITEQNIGKENKIVDFEELYEKVGILFGSHTDIYACRE